MCISDKHTTYDSQPYLLSQPVWACCWLHHMWIMPCGHTDTHTQVRNWEMWVTKTWQIHLLCWIMEQIKFNSSQVEYSGLNNYLFDFCITFKSMHEHVDSWVRHVFRLSITVHRGHRQAHTHARPDVLLHILCLNHNKLPCSAEHNYNAPTKMNSSSTVTHVLVPFFPFLPLLPRGLQYMYINRSTIRSTVTFIHRVCFRWMTPECEMNAISGVQS